MHRSGVAIADRKHAINIACTIILAPCVLRPIGRLARFDATLAASAPELCGRVHIFFVSAPAFRALRNGDAHGMQYILHERAVFDFLKQKRIVADLLDSPEEYKEGLHANVNYDTAGVTVDNS
ncbi:unnamed protein product [Cylicostephanus goldi]|uniref:Uncharacterized protein n=1 Tax=Cylicostephanus goldi TaxID=71465 RepID=A0A3P6R6M0_CYLGO|nr:unnamed protein product [Cylicostephanus goldi]